jgi:hypothetical protein
MANVFFAGCAALRAASTAASTLRQRQAGVVEKGLARSG